MPAKTLLMEVSIEAFRAIGTIYHQNGTWNKGDKMEFVSSKNIIFLSYYRA